MSLSYCEGAKRPAFLLCRHQNHGAARCFDSDHLVHSKLFLTGEDKKISGRFHGVGVNCIAALLGAVTPFCSSSISLFSGFTSAGLPLGITFSFLISSPMVDLGSLVLLMSIFGQLHFLAKTVNEHPSSASEDRCSFSFSLPQIGDRTGRCIGSVSGSGDRLTQGFRANVPRSE